MTRRVLFPLLLIAVGSAWAAQPDLGSEVQLQAGKVLYDKYCSQCHGENGDGLGVAAPYVKPRPRDFTLGKYKVRTTPTGALPTTEDLKNIIRRGMPYSTMPAWPDLTDRELSSLAYFLKSFYPGFMNPDENTEPMDLSTAPSYSEESAQRGREVYINLGCAQCHGDTGRGSGTSAPTLADDWGYHLRPADLTKPWTFRGGSSREDIYRTVLTGFNGTPMPSYADEGALPREDRWALIDYIVSLSGSQGPAYASLLTAVGVDEEIDLEKGAALFEAAPAARFPIMGQVIQPGRNFYPAVTDIEVRAVFNADDIAVLIQWNDMSSETEGSNSPSLPTAPFDPAEEERLQRRTTAVQEATDDFWGDPFAEEVQPVDSGEAGGEASTAKSPYSDAVALQVPLALPTGIRKPYFVFGDSGNPVDLWFLDLASEQPRAFAASGSNTLEEAVEDSLTAVKEYQDGRWSVIFGRKRTSSRSISFEEGSFVPIAFSVWDGFNHERGNKRALTGWYYLYLEPLNRPSALGPMVSNSLTVFIGMIVIVFFARRKLASTARQEDRE